MKKKLLIVISIFVIGLIGWVALYPLTSFSLVGEETIELDYHDTYQEPGYSFKVFGITLNNKVNISGEVNNKKIGSNVITYSYDWGFKKETITRTINVVDRTKPVISSDNPEIIYYNRIKEFNYPKYQAIDEIDGEIEIAYDFTFFDKSWTGYNYLLVKATDKSGNTASYCQPIYVYDSDDGPKKEVTLIDDIYRMIIQDDELLFAGYCSKDNYKLEVDSALVENLDVDDNNPHFYGIKIKLGSLENGEYKITIDDTPVIAYYENPCNRLGRWHVGDKLATFSFLEGTSFTIEDFQYLYDIVIDVGHGNIDPGAIAVDGYWESKLNLKVSLYEKKRFESFGLKVYLNRETQEYKELLGDSDWKLLQKVSWTLGWYGAVSKFAYSNHHNSDELGTTRGPEIIALPITKDQQEIAFTLRNQFRKIYKVINTSYDLFAKDYITGRRYVLTGDETDFDYRCWYGNMRYPYEDFGVKVITFEGCYLNNAADYNWYVKKGNWKKVSEAKIKAYVEALGLTYTPPEE